MQSDELRAAVAVYCKGRVDSPLFEAMTVMLDDSTAVERDVARRVGIDRSTLQKAMKAFKAYVAPVVAESCERKGIRVAR